MKKRKAKAGLQHATSNYWSFVAPEAEVEGLLLVAVVVLLIEEMVLKVDIVLIVLIVEIGLIFEIPEESVPCFWMFVFPFTSISADFVFVGFRWSKSGILFLCEDEGAEVGASEEE